MELFLTFNNLLGAIVQVFENCYRIYKTKIVTKPSVKWMEGWMQHKNNALGVLLDTDSVSTLGIQ